MRKIFIILVLLLGVGICTGTEEKTTVRVGISNNNFSTYEHSSVSFALTEASSVSSESEANVTIEPNDTVDIKIASGLFSVYVNNEIKIKADRGPLVVTSLGNIGIKGLKRKGEPAFYRGMIELKSTKPDKFKIINVLDMQSYLKGVVPNEMPISFGFEALKAQAVAARNYANRPSKVYSNYDVCDSTACQVYYGANSETEISDKAVDETLGIYALYNNEIILALYSSTPSGISENYLDTFGCGVDDLPYLKSVKDTEKLGEMDMEEFFKEKPPSFDMKSPKYRWERTFTKTELENILSKTLFEQSRNGNVEPAFYSTDKIQNLKDIRVIKRGVSNKALEVEIKTATSRYVVKKELPIRRVFKNQSGALYSANFIIEPQFETNGKQAVFENSEKKKDPIGFKFYGAGFGHGVGMSQYGAGYLSSYNVSYDNILKHYYTGITLGTVPKVVTYNNIDLYFVQEFYFNDNKDKTKHENLNNCPLKEEIEALLEKNKNKYFLVIENKDKVSNIDFFINEHHFAPEMIGFNHKILKTDITKYLKNGINKIFFKPLAESDKKKSVKFYVTLGEENE